MQPNKSKGNTEETKPEYNLLVFKPSLDDRHPLKVADVEPLDGALHEFTVLALGPGSDGHLGGPGSVGALLELGIADALVGARRAATAATAASTALKRHEVEARGGHDLAAGVLELVVLALLGLAGEALDVGDDHLGQLLKVGLGAARAAELDGAALHVELAVAGLVDPGPGDLGVARGDVGGDVVGEARVEHGLGVGGHVAVELDRAAAVERRDCPPHCILGWVSFVG